MADSPRKAATGPKPDAEKVTKPDAPVATSYDKGQADPVPADPPQVANDGVEQTATTPMQPMADVSIPDPVALAAGLQSENGATPLGFYDGPAPDASKVSLSGAFEDHGDLGEKVATQNVYERFLAPKTTTPQNRLVAAQGKPVSAARFKALVQAEKAL